MARLREHGPLGVLRQLPTTIRWAIQRGIDRRSGLDTTEQVLAEDLDIADELKAHCRKYEATSSRSLRRMIKALHAHLFEDFVFIDIGCGKGRMLLTAATLPFKRIIGIEISPNLCRIANQNIATMAKTNPTHAPIDVVCQDALTYSLPDENCVIYMFNPMSLEMMSELCKNIDTWLLKHDRLLYIIYYNPVHHYMFENSPNFVKISEKHLLKDLYTPYTHGYTIYRAIGGTRTRERATEPILSSGDYATDAVTS